MRVLVALLLCLFLTTASQAVVITVIAKEVFEPVEIWTGSEWQEANAYTEVNGESVAIFSSVDAALPGPIFRAASTPGGSQTVWSMGSDSIEDGTHQIAVEFNGSSWDFVSWTSPSGMITTAPPGFDGGYQDPDDPGDQEGGGFLQPLNTASFFQGVLTLAGSAMGISMILGGGLAVAAFAYRHVFRRV